MELLELPQLAAMPPNELMQTLQMREVSLKSHNVIALNWTSR